MLMFKKCVIFYSFSVIFGNKLAALDLFITIRTPRCYTSTLYTTNFEVINIITTSKNYNYHPVA